MKKIQRDRTPVSRNQGFTLVEMIVVIGVMSILMTAGAIGLNGLGGKGVSSGVVTTEMLFAEARNLAIVRSARARVLIAKDLTNTPGENLRRILVISEKLDDDGKAIKSDWELSSRGMLLPDKVFFSQEFSKRDAAEGVDGSGPIDEMPTLPNAKALYEGSYFYYEFNTEGICTSPGASFVIGSGVRESSSPSAKPRIIASGKKDFGGFVIWRNGSTSIFRSPSQISNEIENIRTGKEF